MKENGKIAKKKVLESINLPMEVSMKVIGMKMKKMESEKWFILMETLMKENGKMVRGLEEEFIKQEIIPNTRGNGKKINLTELDF